jgi:hypothetical protein
MKNAGILAISVFIALALVFTSGCKQKKTSEPCDNKGKVCITNKLDSTLTVYIQQTHYQFQIEKNYMECVDLQANQPYKITFTGPNHDIRDTTFIVVACDNTLITLQ